MEVIENTAYARAGLMGNPSDGYNGRTISFIVGNFRARVLLYEWEDIEIVLSAEDQTRFRSIEELARDVKLHGYYGGARLVKATIKKFYDYCAANGRKLHERNFSIRHETNIPRQVGLAGSSAIIVGTLRCLMEFYGVPIPKAVQPSLALAVETEELSIGAGLQDRVIQVYEGVMYMDFSEATTVEIDGFRCGEYTPVTAPLPPIYIAYSTRFSEPTEVVHNTLRERFDSGDRAVVVAMDRFAELAGRAQSAIAKGDAASLAELIDANFDLRQSIMALPFAHVEMVEVARAAGASAKFAGSGGAIVGTYDDESMLKRLRDSLGGIGCRVVKPLMNPR